MTESLVGNLMIASTLVPQSVFSRSVCLIVHHDENGAIGVMLNRPISPPPPELIQMLIGGPKGPETVQADHDDADLGDSADIAPANIAPASKCGSKSGGSKRGKSRLPRPADSASSDTGEAADSDSQGNSLSGGPNAKPPGIMISHWGEVYGPVADQAGSAIVHFGGPLSGPVVAVHGTRSLAEAEAGQGVFMAAQREHLEQLIKNGDNDFRLIIGHSAWTTDQLSQEFSAGYWHVLPATQETTMPVRVDLWPQLIRRATGASVASWVGARDNGGWTGLN